MSLKNLILILLGLAFVFFGVLVLITAFHQTNPFYFIIYFFSANFIILISGALVFGLVWRTLRPIEEQPEVEE